MGNRRKTVSERARQKVLAWRCPKCRSREYSRKEYDDAWLYICKGCRFPVRKLK